MVEGDPLTTMLAAITEVRREGYKAAAIHAVVDAALVTVLVNTGLGVLGLAATAYSIPVPASVGAALSRAGVPLAGVSIGVIVSLLAGVAVGVGEVTVYARRPVVERFEAANPSIAEALRTGRDAARDRENTTMARTLYRDITRRLTATSSIGLLDFRRLAITIVLVLVVGLAGVQASVAGIDVTGQPSEQPTVPGSGSSGVPAATGPTILQPGESVLGAPENVSAGSVNLSAEVDTEVGVGAGSQTQQHFDQSGLPAAPSSVEVQRAGYAPAETVEDATLVREYNLEIRGFTNG